MSSIEETREQYTSTLWGGEGVDVRQVRWGDLREGDLILARLSPTDVMTPVDPDWVVETRAVEDVRDWNMHQIRTVGFHPWGLPRHNHEHYLIIRSIDEEGV